MGDQETQLTTIEATVKPKSAIEGWRKWSITALGILTLGGLCALGMMDGDTAMIGIMGLGGGHAIAQTILDRRQKVDVPPQ